MKKVFILFLTLIFGLSIYSMDEFNTLNVETPCVIKIFKADSSRVRVVGNQNVTYEVKDSILKIESDLENPETLILIYSPNEQEIKTNLNKFRIKEVKY